jgi:threonyl-tRNA synthetase
MADSIHVKLPDGSVKEVPKGTTALDIAKSISPRLADAALAAKTNGDLIDLTKPLEKDTDLRLLTDKDPEALEVYRHSSAHLLAAAVLELFPETKLGHGPATESGFFYDFYRPTPFTPEDLEKIEKKMQELVQQNLPLRARISAARPGLAEFKKEGDFMKCHFIEQFTKPDEKISIYRTGKFTTSAAGRIFLRRGRSRHSSCSTLRARIGWGMRRIRSCSGFTGLRFFRRRISTLISAGGRGEEARPSRAGAAARFVFDSGAGRAGADFLASQGRDHPQEMEDWMREQYLKRGYSLVYTPHVARRQLFFTSGHEGYYAQNMFDAMELDDAEYR